MTTIADYILQLHKEIEENSSPYEEKNSPMEIVIKPEALDISNLESGEGSKQYRPTTFDEYIGQEEAKHEILDELKGCEENNEPFSHTFISAPAGHGKTALAEIIAHMSNKKVVKTTGGQLKNEQSFVDIINECEGGYILIDEANKINSKVGFFMLPVIEKFEINNQKLQPFTVIFMTTHKGDLSKDLDALIQRCNLQLELNHYKVDELITILKKYKDKQYPNENITDDIYIKIVKNSKYTPRIARTLLRKYIFNKNLERVFKNSKIIKDGLTYNDLKVLKFLLNHQKGASKQTLANYLRVKSQTYEFDIEPYLIFKEYIIVEGKRKITEKGKQFLEGLK